MGYLPGFAYMALFPAETDPTSVCRMTRNTDCLTRFSMRRLHVKISPKQISKKPPQIRGYFVSVAPGVLVLKSIKTPDNYYKAINQVQLGF